MNRNRMIGAGMALGPATLSPISAVLGDFAFWSPWGAAGAWQVARSWHGEATNAARQPSTQTGMLRGNEAS